MIYFISNQTSSFESSIYSRSTIQHLYEYCKDLLYIGVDFETEGFDPFTCRPISIQIGDFNNQFVIDLFTVDIELLRNLLEDSNKTLVFQNAKFDLGFLYVANIFPNNVFDTFLAESILYLGIQNDQKALDKLAKKYCNVDLDKSIRGNIHREGLSERVIKYGADDVKYLIPIMDCQFYTLNREKLLNFMSLNNSFVLALTYVEFCGIKLDVDKWTIKCQEDTTFLIEKRDKLDDFIRSNSDFHEFLDPQLDIFNPQRTINLNWNSSDQVIPVFKKMGINTILIKDGEEKDSIDITNLSKYRKTNNFVSTYIEYREYQKLVSTYGKNWLKFIHPKTKRIHTRFRQLLNTGRISSGSKESSGKFPNIQQIPADERHRSCFIAEPGNTLVIADYSSQEPRILAEYSKEPNLYKFYTSGEADLHSYVVKLVYPELSKLSLAEIAVLHKDKRQLMKSVNFSLAYGGEASTIARNANISLEKAKEVYNLYFKAFPQLRKFFDIQRKLPLIRGYILIDPVTGAKSYIDKFEEYIKLQSTVNDKRFREEYHRLKNTGSKTYDAYLRPQMMKYLFMRGTIERNGLNTPIQGTAANMTKVAVIYFYKEFIKSKKLFNIVKIVNIIHDEIVVECPMEMGKEVSDKLKECMERAGKLFCKSIPITTNPEINSWWKH